MKRWAGFVAVLAVLAMSAGCSPAPGADDDDDNDDDDDIVGAIDSGTRPGDPDGALAPNDPDAAPVPGDPDAAPVPGRPDAAPAPGDPDARPPVTGIAPGGGCTCDADCDSDTGRDGICVYGLCMTRASADCSAGGSSVECGAGSRCWGLAGETGSICWPDCDAYSCDGACDSDGSCAPTSGSDCGYTCGSYCACEAGECGDGMTCVSGSCVPEASGEGPGAGPGPDCPGLPARDCSGGEAYCGALTTFSPRTTASYDDYPINGETASSQYRSYLRRDLKMLLEYATARTLCKTAGWDSGIGGALGLGDMSEVDGAIPGTAIGRPGHPATTHVNGYDIDLAYYQIGTPDNKLRPVCTHTVGDTDVNHCTAEPELLDVWRTAMFLGTVFESSRVSAIGVDGRVGPPVRAAIDELCATGWLSEYACSHIALAYEVTDEGYGWYRFHHHHAHIKTLRVGVAPWDRPAAMPCKQSGCGANSLKPHPRKISFGY